MVVLELSLHYLLSEMSGGGLYLQKNVWQRIE